MVVLCEVLNVVVVLCEVLNVVVVLCDVANVVVVLFEVLNVVVVLLEVANVVVKVVVNSFIPFKNQDIKQSLQCSSLVCLNYLTRSMITHLLRLRQCFVQ